MLKRSFAEFHAQRSHPEALQKLAEGKARLEALRAKPWPHSPQATSQQDVEEYYHLSEHIQALTNHIQVRIILLYIDVALSRAYAARRLFRQAECACQSCGVQLCIRQGKPFPCSTAETLHLSGSAPLLTVCIVSKLYLE